MSERKKIRVRKIVLIYQVKYVLFFARKKSTITRADANTKKKDFFSCHASVHSVEQSFLIAGADVIRDERNKKSFRSNSASVAYE